MLIFLRRKATFLYHYLTAGPSACLPFHMVGAKIFFIPGSIVKVRNFGNGQQNKMARVLGSIRLPLGSLGSGGMYLQTMEISTVLQLETAII